MDNNVVDFKQTRAKRFGEPARISVSLNNVARKFRQEFLNARDYQRIWLGQIPKNHYSQLLHASYRARKTLEDLLSALGDTFIVNNLFDGSQKQFDIETYVTERRCKSSVLYNDIVELTGQEPEEINVPEKTQELIDYMSRVRGVYSVALLGILYMLEETVSYAGPRIAKALDHNLDLKGKATGYLRGDNSRKKDLWEFRNNLDLITDFQSQANIVIAATITYGIYRDSLNPRTLRTIRSLQEKP